MADEKTTTVMEQKPAPAVAKPEAATAAVDTKKQRAAPKKKATTKKAGKAVMFVKSKRKRAIARASSQSGTGKIRLNGFDIQVYNPVELRRLMLEPLYISSATKDIGKHIDIKVNVYGGGQSSQAQAVRGAIAKSIVANSGTGDAMKLEMIHYDRFILIDDARRVEPKKFKGPKARARFQKSYR